MTALQGILSAHFFAIYNDMDQEYEWSDFLAYHAYHIEKYNINLPDEFLKKIECDTGEKVIRMSRFPVELSWKDTEILSSFRYNESVKRLAAGPLANQVMAYGVLSGRV